MKINEGGNVTATNKKTGIEISAQKIPLQKVGIQNFRNKFFDLFKELNSLYKKKYKDFLWPDLNDIKNGMVFNGSTSYIMNPDYNEDELLKYKPSAGDLDIMVPEEKSINLWHLLDSIEGEKIGDFTYHGNNRLNAGSIGTQINALFILHTVDGDIRCQVDFEFLPFEMNNELKYKPSQWAKFSHGSSFEDAKTIIKVNNKNISIKAFSHKLLLRSMVGALSVNPHIVIATSSSTAEKFKIKKMSDAPRMQQFSVDRGLGNAYEPLIDKNGQQVTYEGKPVFREKKSEERTYVTDLNSIFNSLFKDGNIADFHSFVGLVKLLKSTDKNTQQVTVNRFFDVLFGMGAQVIEPTTPNDDFEVKMAPLQYLLDNLKIKIDGLDNKVKMYYEKKWKAK